ncbi:MAG: phosphomannomutase/phosphoglucomutase [Ornithinimicrobium sp.]|uniref:phosphomannomutase/phosphoglucomutase n=1 Tax=Ornithinimicrobium sp. TaxID=1977084 RepID=UPI003D9BCA39
MTSGRVERVVNAYDVRGRVPDELDAEVCAALGSAFAQVVLLPEGAAGAVVGHDMRESSPALRDAVIEGIRGQGLDVTSIGLCSTDELYYATGVLAVPGVMVTASHNPGHYNGLKMCRARALPVGADSGLPQIRDLAQWLLDRGDLHPGPGAPVRRGHVHEVDLLADYARHLHSLVDLSASRELSVVVDAGNGMAGLTVPAVFEQHGLPVRVIPLYFELDGSFPHHEANPLDTATLTDLRRAVLEHGADLGLAFDGDADRCFVVDEVGRPVPASAVVALLAQRLIAAEQASGVPPEQVHVVHTTLCSRVVLETVTARGARPVRSPVGHTFVKAQMAQHAAVFGGEHSGHYYFRDFFGADSGLLGAMHVLAILGEQPEPVSRLLAPFQTYATSGEVNLEVTDRATALRQVCRWGRQQEGVQVEEVDGVVLTHPGPPLWWASVRGSVTEALLRLNVEAADEHTVHRVQQSLTRVATVGTVSP